MSAPDGQPLELPLEVRWGAATHRGARRSLNEDSHLASGRAFVVADGMGGHDAGEVASRVAVEALGPLSAGLREAPGGSATHDVEERLAIAHERLQEIGTAPGRGAGTTITGVILVEHEGAPYWLVLNLGDSRTYLLVDGRLEQVSVDHSEVQELLDAGAITAAEARTHPRRHVVTRALGPGPRPAADFWFLPVGAHDRMLVCSDGLTVELDDDRIAELLLADPDPQVAADRLVAEALHAGGRDNITVVVVDARYADDDAGAERTAPRAETETDDEDTLPRAHGLVMGGPL